MGDGPAGFDILYLPFSSWAGVGSGMLTVFCMKSFGTPPPPLPDCKIGLGPGALSYQEIESSQPLLDLSPCVVIPFVSDSIFVLLFCLSLCAIWHLANTTKKSVPWGKAALSWLLGGTVGHGGLTHTTEADLALPLLYVSKALFQPLLHCVVFSLAAPMSRCKSVGISTSGDRQQMSFTWHIQS